MDVSGNLGAMIPAAVFAICGALFWVAAAIVHIIFAVAVYRDARRLGSKGRHPVLVDAWAWVLGTALGGVLVVGLYWAVHHSTLSREVDAV